MVEFSDEMFRPANLEPRVGAKDRSDEKAQVDRDLAALDRHVSAGDARKGDEAFRPLQGSFPVTETLTDLKGREYPQQKPLPDRESNYPAGLGGFALKPNREDQEVDETLEG
jgi:hypothetical protein